MTPLDDIAAHLRSTLDENSQIEFDARIAEAHRVAVVEVCLRLSFKSAEGEAIRKMVFDAVGKGRAGRC